MYYGNAPTIICKQELNSEEFCFVQYLPIKLKHSYHEAIPKNLLWMRALVDAIDPDEFVGNYVYVTAKRLWLTETFKDNRGGWHSDGFMSDDINYIWYDTYPTEFCVQQFNLTEDHTLAMQEMTEQVQPEKIVTYPSNTMLKIDPSVIHRTNTTPYNGLRTFVKISISKDKYNLIGNAHNHLLDYNWDMKPRSEARNNPVNQEETVK